jgi:hypothetical protein
VRSGKERADGSEIAEIPRRWQSSLYHSDFSGSLVGWTIGKRKGILPPWPAPYILRSRAVGNVRVEFGCPRDTATPPARDRIGAAFSLARVPALASRSHSRASARPAFRRARRTARARGVRAVTARSSGRSNALSEIVYRRFAPIYLSGGCSAGQGAVVGPRSNGAGAYRYTRKAYGSWTIPKLFEKASIF